MYTLFISSSCLAADTAGHEVTQTTEDCSISSPPPQDHHLIIPSLAPLVSTVLHMSLGSSSVFSTDSSLPYQDHLIMPSLAPLTNTVPHMSLGSSSSVFSTDSSHPSQDHLIPSLAPLTTTVPHMSLGSSSSVFSTDMDPRTPYSEEDPPSSLSCQSTPGSNYSTSMAGERRVKRKERKKRKMSPTTSGFGSDDNKAKRLVSVCVCVSLTIVGVI